jgi:lipoprotein-anchoring transpeptidase ErfK/SrfK
MPQFLRPFQHSTRVEGRPKSPGRPPRSSYLALVFVLLVAFLVAPAAALAAPADSPASPENAQLDDGATTGKWIDINLRTQRLTAYVGSKAVYSTLISSGKAPRYTATGRFKIYRKLKSQTMVGPGYRLPGVPNVMYFMGANAIHGAYWHNNFGHPMSHGCINVPVAKSGWLYAWAPIGTPVSVHY